MKRLYSVINIFTLLVIIATPSFFRNDFIKTSDLIVAAGCVLFLLETFINSKVSILTSVFTFIGLFYVFLTVYAGDETIIYMLRIEAYLFKLNISKPELLDYFHVPFWVTFLLAFICSTCILLIFISKLYFFFRKLKSHSLPNE